MSMLSTALRRLTPLLLCGAVLASAQEASPPDVRLLIDVSGSMKANDPDNLRRDGLELLVQLLPEGAEAGVWTFGHEVNLLVPHRPVDAAWKSGASEAVEAINSVALFTNIPEALDRAAWDREGEGARGAAVILLTDGMVDIDRDPAANARARQRILQQLLPELREAEITIHTIALSPNADRELMERLAADSGGLFAVAETAEALGTALLGAFDAAAPAEELPLRDSRFVVDSSIEEFTALILRGEGSGAVRLESPEGSVLDARRASDEVKWLSAPAYDLVTIKQPWEGEWHVTGPLAPDSRVTVVSDLSLEVDRLPASVFGSRGQTRIGVRLEEEGEPVARPEFLRLVEVGASVRRAGDGREWELEPEPQAPAGDQGIWTLELPMLREPGTYEIRVSADGKTFARQQRQTVQVRDSFTTDVESGAGESEAHRLSLFAQDPRIDPAATGVSVSLQLPDGSTRTVPVAAEDHRSWALRLRELPQAGSYQAIFNAAGAYRDGESFSWRSDPLDFRHAVAAGAAENQPPARPDTRPESPEAAEPPAPEAATPAEPAEAASEDKQLPWKKGADSTVESEDSGSRWIVWVALVAGNLLIIGLAFLAWRTVSAGSRPEADKEAEAANDAVQAEASPGADAERAEKPAAAAPAPAPDPDPELDEVVDIEKAEDGGEAPDADKPSDTEKGEQPESDSESDRGRN